MKTILVISAALAALPLAAWAQTTSTSTTSTTSTSTTASSTVPGDRLVDRYSDLAGSEKNAKALVDGLRDGKKITLTEGKTTTTIDTPTKKMGYGNINIALAIAEKSLADQGITDPTAEQLKTALMGGEIKTRTGTVKMEGVLQMRADGMGWGQIANKLGFKVGEVVGRAPARASTERSGPGKPERVARAEKPERPVKVERPERPARPDKPERPGK